jgi:hypothetical protein
MMQTAIDSHRTAPTRRPRLVAFHLPQFHPTPENDAWWGRGFTEWFNVARARALFPGHYQPHIPADLGFYDLRLPEARAAQAELARAYGIEAFCYYHYWFHGTRLLHRPVDEILSTGEPDFPFCLCWANEPWSRTWLGDEREMLIAQRYSEEDDVAHAQHLLPRFADPRYLTVDGRAVFLIYRASHIPDAARTITTLREVVVRAGLPNPYIVLADGREPGKDLRVPYGADMTLRFEPQLGALPWVVDEAPQWRRSWHSIKVAGLSAARFRVYDYADCRARMRAIRSAGPAIRSVLVRWDNTPRRAERGIIMTGATPDVFARELRSELALPEWNNSGTDLLFLNAWNEWAEGNHLEPDREYGLAYLDAVREVMAQYDTPVAPRELIRVA